MGWRPIFPDVATAQTAPPPAVAAAAGGVKAAQAAIQSLHRKFEAAKQRGTELETERGELAYAAHSGDRAARKRLTEINIEVSQHQSEIDSFSSALVEARKRLVEAEAAVEHAARRADAERAVHLAAEMKAAGQLAGEALIALVVRLRKFMDLNAEAHQLGHSPSGGLVQANVRRSLGNALSALGVGERQPPSQRVELGALLQHYSGTAEASARRVLGEGDEEAA